MKNNIEMIRIEKLHPHPQNLRKELGDLTELTNSIKESGVFQNLTVVPHEELEGEYTVLIGHRRLEAAKLAGLEALPCMITAMNQKEQLATMLLENMQRCDLTIIEQAQGIQMMIDLGESVEQISQKTGLSKSTIYKRKNIAELDQEESKKALERGASLMDFLELEKIKDPETKNGLLKKMGSKEFKWNLERAITEEKIKENSKIILSMLQDYTKETELDHSRHNYKPLLTIDGLRDPKHIVLPTIEADGEYIFTQNRYYFSLYKKTKRDNKRDNTRNQEQEKLDQENKERNERRGALHKLTEQSYQMRKEYILNLSNNSIRKKTKEIQAFLGTALLEDNNNWGLRANFQKMSEINLHSESNENESELEEWNRLCQELAYNANRNIMIITFLLIDSQNHCSYTWQGEYCQDKETEIAYQFAEMLGYECSEEEMQLRDGSHTLYWEEEK